MPATGKAQWTTVCNVAALLALRVLGVTSAVVKQHLRHDIHKHNASLTTAYAQANPNCGFYACVAVKSDGTAVAWGNAAFGGDASSVDLTNVAAAMCGGYACVAVKNDGTAVCWGVAADGGDCSSVDLTNVAGDTPSPTPSPTLILTGTPTSSPTSSPTNVTYTYAKVLDCSSGSITGPQYTEMQTPTIEDCVSLAVSFGHNYFTYGTQSGETGTQGGVTYVSDGVRANDCIMCSDGAFNDGLIIYNSCRWHVYQVLSQAPTTAPTPATATGDPHLQNVHGERFDLMTPGKVTLVNIPRGKRVEDALLAVEADARRLGGHCADMYFQTVNITGVWADKLQAGGFTFDAQGAQSHKVPEWTTFGPLEVKVVHGRTEKGILYLNVFVKNLGRAGVPVGGLLGEDDHTEAAAPADGCQKLFSLKTGPHGLAAHRQGSIAVGS